MRTVLGYVISLGLTLGLGAFWYWMTFTNRIHGWAFARQAAAVTMVIALVVALTALVVRVALRGRQKLIWPESVDSSYLSPAAAEPTYSSNSASSSVVLLSLGMSVDDLIARLGPPDSTACADDFRAGAHVSYGSTPASLQGRVWYTWQRPEGLYSVTIQDGRLVKIQSAPQS